MSQANDRSTVPVLLLGFNRPDKIRTVLEPLRHVKPQRVFVAVDGPREGHSSDEENCRATQREADDGIDWPCTVQKLYRTRNLGCRVAVSEAITWAFRDVDELMVVEDDCILDPSFFTLCRVVLDRHRDDERVFCFGAVNYQDGQRRGDGDYYASKYPHCWGWATWKRAWAHYVGDIVALRPFVESPAFEACHDSAAEIA